jgi:hypothetical protein
MRVGAIALVMLAMTGPAAAETFNSSPPAA